MWPFHTGDCSLEVMACTGLTVYLTFVQAPGSDYDCDYNISVISWQSALLGEETGVVGNKQ